MKTAMRQPESFWHAIRPALLTLTLLMLSLLTLVLLTPTASAQTEECHISFNNGASLWLPVARTWQEQEQGLSGRLDVGPGLLFVWSEAAVRVFWMKDTHVPLSIAFIAADGRVLSIEDMAPESLDRHPAPAPITAAMELPQGEFTRLAIKPGDTASIHCTEEQPLN